jgi:tetratricopeptide (TPR) repeat protein
LSVAYDRTGDQEESLGAVKHATLLNPVNPEYNYLLGWAYSKAGHHKESIEPLKRAIELKPSYALAHFHLGLAYHTVGDKASALEQHRILTTLDAELAKKLYDSITSARLTDR